MSRFWFSVGGEDSKRVAGVEGVVANVHHRVDHGLRALVLGQPHLKDVGGWVHPAGVTAHAGGDQKATTVRFGTVRGNSHPSSRDGHRQGRSVELNSVLAVRSSAARRTVQRQLCQPLVAATPPHDESIRTGCSEIGLCTYPGSCTPTNGNVLLNWAR